MYVLWTKFIRKHAKKTLSSLFNMRLPARQNDFKAGEL